jgi:PAS domain-containing protein
VALSERRQAVFKESKSLALRTIVGFVLLMLIVSLVYYKKVISPLSKASMVVRRILSGDSGARFQEGSGAMGAFGAELNLMAESIDRHLKLKAFECAGLRSTLQEKSIQIGAVASIMSFAGKSLSQNEVFGYALGEVAAAACPDSCAVYMLEGGHLKLKASVGLDDKFEREAGTLAGFPKGLSPDSVVIDNISILEEPLRGALMAVGAQLAASVPLVYNNEAAGLLLIVYRDPERFNSEQLRFFEAVAASIAVASGHSGLFQREHSTRKFFERLLAQLPVGLAVFASDGKCSLMSAQARRMLGVDPGMEASSYSVFEDELLASQGILTTIRKSYEGYSTEFIINYSPMSSRALGIAMAPVRLRIRSFPLYDAGGEISNVALLYEDLTGTAESPGGRA